SFAQLVYISAWIKRHHPAVFAAALLNSQPMGFYAPAQIVRDARAHGVEVRPVDVAHSNWDCTIENGALRLGLRLVTGLSEAAAQRLVAARPFANLAEMAGRAGLDRGSVERLAEADALRGLGLGRRAALWEAAAVEREAPLATPVQEAAPQLPLATAGERVVLDYAGTGLTLGPHPLALLRPKLRALRCADTRALEAARQGAWLRLAGLVLVRQRPGSAKGVMFFTLEDERGVANLVLYADLQRRFRREIVAARLLVAEGRVERTEAHVPILHLVARRLEDRSDLLHDLHALRCAAPTSRRIRA
ncbi:MAG: error-prone DNA polymerase, partial [Rubritepida sp.]|nr:error-prone DNA polymerase [Rubritepida sp.]